MATCTEYEAEYHVASLNGVTFTATSMTDQFGRRGPSHQFPDRDTPFAEDLGRRQEHYNVSGYYIGDDHVAWAKSMRRAANAMSPARLTHPIWGTLLVKVEECSIEHDLDREQRQTSVKIKAVEFGSLALPTSLAGVGFALSAALGGIATALGDIVDGAWSLAGLIPQEQDQTLAALQVAAATLSSSMPGAVVWTAEAVDLAYTLTRFVDDPVLAAQSPRIVLVDPFDILHRNAVRPALALTMFRPLLRFGAGTITGSRQVQDNLNIIATVIRTMAVVYSVQSAIDLVAQPVAPVGSRYATKPANVRPLSTSDQAASYLEQMRSLLAQEIAIAAARCDDDLYRQLIAVRHRITAEIEKMIAGLPARVRFDCCALMPSLAAAHRATGDARDVLTIETVNLSNSVWWMPRVIEHRG